MSLIYGLAITTVLLLITFGIAIFGLAIRSFKDTLLYDIATIKSDVEILHVRVENLISKLSN